MIVTWTFIGMLFGATVASPPAASLDICEAYAVILRERGAIGDCREHGFESNAAAAAHAIKAGVPEHIQKKPSSRRTAIVRYRGGCRPRFRRVYVRDDGGPLFVMYGR